MEEFALLLEGCSKADRKKCQKAHDSVSGYWADDDRFKDGDWKLIHFIDGTRYYTCCDDLDVTVYQMPQDWDKIQRALGIEEESGYIEVIGCTGAGWYSDRVGEIFKYYNKSAFYGGMAYGTSKEKGLFGITLCDAKLSTREAYEAQEAKKFEDDEIKAIGYTLADIAKNFGLKNMAEVVRDKNHIKELEEENEKLKKSNQLKEEELCEIAAELRKLSRYM